MRAERLASIARDIVAEFDETEILDRVSELVDALDELAGNATSSNEAAVAASRADVADAVRRSFIPLYPPALRDVLSSMELDHLLGDNLLVGINSDIERNGITPGVARDEIQKRLDDLKALHTQATAVVAALDYFKIEPDDLAPGAFEVMVQVPGRAIHDELGQFGREAQRLNSILGVFTEIATGTREPIKLRAIGSSDPTFFLDSLPATAALLATSIERIAAFYAQIQGIIKTHRDMKAQDVPAPVVEGMKRHIDDSIKAGLDQIAKTIERENMKAVPADRKAELRTELKNSLYEIARRVDEGYVFDVRGAAPVEEEGEGSPAAEQAASARAYRVVEEVRPRIQHFVAEDEPILSLPHPDGQ